LKAAGTESGPTSLKLAGKHSVVLPRDSGRVVCRPACVGIVPA
jgi:hypothetical protein